VQLIKLSLLLFWNVRVWSPQTNRWFFFERRRVVNENLARREAHPEIFGHIYDLLEMAENLVDARFIDMLLKAGVQHQ
jgi:hypothetical protein